VSLALPLFLAGFAYGALLILVLGLCVSAAHADRLADRILGPGSSADLDLELGLLIAMDESRNPPSERRRDG
jgi:hypothetical protein